MTPSFRPPEAFVHGHEGPVVVVPARVATWLLRRAGLEAYHRDHRGADPEVDAVLTALKVADRAWRAAQGADQGTGADSTRSEQTGCPWLSTREAAARLGITDRAVRKAIAGGRLKADWVGGVHALDPEDVALYRPRRVAA